MTQPETERTAPQIGKADGGKLEWTLHWTEENAWLGYNVEVQVGG